MIPIEWHQSLGAGARVLVLDAGFDQAYPHLQPVEIRNFTNKPLIHYSRHGTEVCKLVAGRNPNYLGIAPYCDLYFGRVWDGDRNFWLPYERGLAWALELKPDVLNFSIRISSLSNRFKLLLQKVLGQGTLVVASHHPASDLCDVPGIIAAGLSEPVRTGHVSIISGYQDISPEPGVQPFRGTSATAAIISGLAACARAANPHITREELLTILNQPG